MKTVLVKDLIQELKRFEPETVVTGKDINNLIKEISFKQKYQYQAQTNFLNDLNKMCDMLHFDKYEFLRIHPEIDTVQYDITSDMYYSNRVNNFKKLQSIFQELYINNKLDNTLLNYKHILDTEREKVA